MYNNDELFIKFTNVVEDYKDFRNNQPYEAQQQLDDHPYLVGHTNDAGILRGILCIYYRNIDYMFIGTDVFRIHPYVFRHNDGELYIVIHNLAHEGTPETFDVMIIEDDLIQQAHAQLALQPQPPVLVENGYEFEL